MQTKIEILLLSIILWGCSVQSHVSLQQRSENEKEQIYLQPFQCKNSHLFLDNLWRDSLIYQQDTILINYSPLLDFDQITRAILRENETEMGLIKNGKKWRALSSITLHCRREYTACWYIQEGKLYLGEVTPRGFYINQKGVNFFEERASVSQKLINKRIEKATGREYKNDLLFADWVNGAIEGNIGGIKDSTQNNLVIINSPHKVKLQFEQGVLKKINVIDLKQ